MSPSVKEIRRAAEARMRELEPVIREIEQLREILQVTGGGTNSAAKPQNGLRGPERGPDGRAVRGSNKTVIMELVRANPGIAAPEIAATTDLKREIISATMYRMKKQGVLEEYGKGVRVAVAPAKTRKFILELADSKPGITTAEIADVTGLEPAVAAVTIELLQKNGELEEHDEGFALAGTSSGS